MKTKILAMVALTMALSSVHAQVYSWTDAQGVKHYGDAASGPPPSARQINVRIAARYQAAPDGSDQATAADTQAKAKAKAKASSPDEQACQEATRNRDLLADESKKVMKSKPDERGTAVEMTLDERAQSLERAQQQVQAFCKGN